MKNKLSIPFCNKKTQIDSFICFKKLKNRPIRYFTSAFVQECMITYSGQCVSAGINQTSSWSKMTEMMVYYYMMVYFYMVGLFIKTCDSS